MQVATTISDDNGMIVKRLSVPIGLEELMESLTKQVLLKKPRDIYAFASEHFAHLLTLRDKTIKGGGVPQSPSSSEKSASNALKSIKVKSHTVATKFNKLPTPIIFTNSNTKRQTTPIANTKRNTKKNPDISPRLVDRSLTTSSSSSHKSNRTEPANQGRVGRARWKKRDSSLKDPKLPVSLPPKKPTTAAKIGTPVSRPKKNEDKGKARPISNRSSDDQSDSKKDALKRRSKSIEANKKKPTLSQSSSVDESISVKGASISLNNKNKIRKSKSPIKSVVAPVIAVAGVAAATLNNKKRGDVAINNEINLEKSDKQDLMESIKSDVDSSLAEISDSILIKDELKVEIKDDAGDSDFVDEDDKESFVIEEGVNENEEGRERLETIAERAMSKQDVANMGDVIEEKTELKEFEEVSNALTQEGIDIEETKFEDSLIENKEAEIAEAVAELEAKIEDTLTVDNISRVNEISESAENIEQAELEIKLENEFVEDKVAEVDGITEAIETIKQDELEEKLVEVVENMPTENIGQVELENEVAGFTEAIENIENSVKDELIQSDDAHTVDIVELGENETVEDEAGEESREAAVGIVEADDDIVKQTNDADVNGVEIIELETDTNNEIIEKVIDISDKVAVTLNPEVAKAENSINLIGTEKETVVETEEEPKQMDISSSDETEIKEETQAEVVSKLEQEVADIGEVEIIGETMEERTSATKEVMENVKLEEPINAIGDELAKHEEHIIDAIEGKQDFIENKMEEQSANNVDEQTLKNMSDETIKDILLSDAKANEIIEQDEKIKDVLLNSMETAEFANPDIHNLTSRFLSLEKENYDTNQINTEGQTAFEERELVEETVVPTELIAENSIPSEVVEQVNAATDGGHNEAPSILETISRKMSDVKAFFTPGSREKESDDAPGDVDENADENLEVSNKEEKAETNKDIDEDMKQASVDVVDSTSIENIEEERSIKIGEDSPSEAEIKTTTQTEEVILEATNTVKLENGNIEAAENRDLDNSITVEDPADAVVIKKDDEEGSLVEQIAAKLPLNDSNNSIIVEDALSLKSSEKSEADNIINPEEKTSDETFVKEEVIKIEEPAVIGNEEREDLKIDENNGKVIEESESITDVANAPELELDEKLEDKSVPITEIEVAKSGIKVYDDLIIETTSDGAEILNLEQQILNDNETEEKNFNVDDKNVAEEINKIAEGAEQKEDVTLKEEESVGEITKETAGDILEDHIEKSETVDSSKSPIEDTVGDEQSQEELALKIPEDLNNKLEEDSSKTATLIDDDIINGDGSTKLEEIIEANVDSNSDKSINVSETNEGIGKIIENPDNTSKITNDSGVEKPIDTLENNNQEIPSSLKNEDEESEKRNKIGNTNGEENEEVVDEEHDLVEEDKAEGQEIEPLNKIATNDSNEEIKELQDGIATNNLEPDRIISPKFSNESILNLDELQIEDESNISTENLPSHIEDEGPLQLEALTQYLMSQNNSNDSENENEPSDNNKDKKTSLDDDKELEALSQYLMNKPDIDNIIDDKDKTDTLDKASLEQDDDTDNQIDSITNSTFSTINNNNNSNEWEAKEIFGQTVKPNEPLIEALKLFPEHQAATKIQSVWRGHNTRKMAVPQQLSGDLSSISDDAVTAATIIQAFVRGHLVRKELSKDNLIGNKIKKLEPFIEESGEIEDALVKLDEIKVPDDEPEIKSIDIDKKEINDTNIELSEKSEENNTYTVAADGKDSSVEDTTYIIKQDDPKENEKKVTEKSDPEDVIVGNLNFIMQGDSQDNADIPSTKKTELEITEATTTSLGHAPAEVVLSDNNINDSPILENQLGIQNADIGVIRKDSTGQVNNALENDKTSNNATEGAHRDKQNISSGDKLTSTDISDTNNVAEEAHGDKQNINNDDKLTSTEISDSNNAAEEAHGDKKNINTDGKVTSDSNNVAAEAHEDKQNINTDDKLSSTEISDANIVSDQVLQSEDSNLSEEARDSLKDIGIETDGNDSDKAALLSDKLPFKKEELSESTQLSSLDSNTVLDSMKNNKGEADDTNDSNDSASNSNLGKIRSTEIDDEVAKSKIDLKLESSIVEDNEEIKKASTHENTVEHYPKENDEEVQIDDKMDKEIKHNLTQDEVTNIKNDDGSEVQNNMNDTNLNQPEDNAEDKELKSVVMTDNEAEKESPEEHSKEGKVLLNNEGEHEMVDEIESDIEDPLKPHDNTESKADELNLEATATQVMEEPQDINEKVENDATTLLNGAKTPKEKESEKQAEEIVELTSEKDDSKSKDITDHSEKNENMQIKDDEENKDITKREVDQFHKTVLNEIQPKTEKDQDGDKSLQNNEDVQSDGKVEAGEVIIGDDVENSESAQAESENSLQERHASEENKLRKIEESKLNGHQNDIFANDENQPKEISKSRRKRDISGIEHEDENTISSDENKGQDDISKTSSGEEEDNSVVKNGDLKIAVETNVANVQGIDDSNTTDNKQSNDNVAHEETVILVEDNKESPDIASLNSAQNQDNTIPNENLMAKSDVQKEETVDNQKGDPKVTETAKMEEDNNQIASNEDEAHNEDKPDQENKSENINEESHDVLNGKEKNTKENSGVNSPSTEDIEDINKPSTIDDKNDQGSQEDKLQLDIVKPLDENLSDCSQPEKSSSIKDSTLEEKVNSSEHIKAIVITETNDKENGSIKCEEDGKIDNNLTDANNSTDHPKIEANTTATVDIKDTSPIQIDVRGNFEDRDVLPTNETSRDTVINEVLNEEKEVKDVGSNFTKEQSEDNTMAPLQQGTTSNEQAEHSEDKSMAHSKQETIRNDQAKDDLKTEEQHNENGSCDVINDTIPKKPSETPEDEMDNENSSQSEKEGVVENANEQAKHSEDNTMALSKQGTISNEEAEDDLKTEGRHIELSSSEVITDKTSTKPSETPEDEVDNGNILQGDVEVANEQTKHSEDNMMIPSKGTISNEQAKDDLKIKERQNENGSADIINEETSKKASETPKDYVSNGNSSEADKMEDIEDGNKQAKHSEDNTMAPLKQETISNEEADDLKTEARSAGVINDETSKKPSETPEDKIDNGNSSQAENKGEVEHANEQAKHSEDNTMAPSKPVTISNEQAKDDVKIEGQHNEKESADVITDKTTKNASETPKDEIDLKNGSQSSDVEVANEQAKLTEDNMMVSSKPGTTSNEQAEDDLKIEEQDNVNESSNVINDKTSKEVSETQKDEIDNENSLQSEKKGEVEDPNTTSADKPAIANSDILANKDVPTTDSNENNDVMSEKIVGVQNDKNASLGSDAQVENSNIVDNNKELVVKSKDETNNENAQDAQDDKAQNTPTNITNIDVINKAEQNKSETIPQQENSTSSIKDGSNEMAKEFQLGATTENVTSDAHMYGQDSIKAHETLHDGDSEMSNDFTSIESNDDDNETKDILAQIKSDLNHMRNLITNKNEDELASENSEENDNKAVDHLNSADISDPERIHSPLSRLISTGSTTSLDSSVTADRDRLVSTGSTTSLDSAATVLLTEDLNKWRAKNDLNEENKHVVDDGKEESNINNKDKLITTDNENSDNLKDFNKTKAPKIGSELPKAVSIEEAAMRIQNFFKCYMANKHDGHVEENCAENQLIQNEECNLVDEPVEDINQKNVKQRPTLGQFIRSLADSTSPPPDLSLDLQRLKTPSPNNLNSPGNIPKSGSETENLQRDNSPSVESSDANDNKNIETKIEPIKSVDTEKPEPFYLHEPDKITENPISAAIRASSQMTNQEPSIGLLHSGEFHDSLPLNYAPTNLQVVVQNHRAPPRTATPSPPGLLHSGELHDALIPHFRDAAAGAAPVTVAQASDKDGQARSKAETDKEDVPRESVSELELSDMDGKRNNAAIAEKNTESDAATKIQASFRGYQVRKQLKTTGGGDITSPRRSGRRKSSGRVIDSNKNPPKKDKGELEERSATKIQAGIRGFLVRRRQKNKNESP